MSVKPSGCCTQIRLPEAVVPRETLHCFVTADLHDGEGIYSRPPHIGDRRMAEVMKVEAFDSGQLGGSRKSPSEVCNRLSLPEKDVPFMQRPGPS
jgi:hypothetical protein